MLRSVATLVLPKVDPFELGVACEVFGVDRTDTGGPRFDFRLVTPEPGVVPANFGYDLIVSDGLEAAADADLIVIAAYGRGVRLDADTAEFLRQAHARGTLLLSLCSGAFALAAAGLLDGRSCTTHWIYTERLAQLVPTATVNPNVLYVEDTNIVTSAGTSAAIDACLHVVRRELGAAAAASIARRMVVPPHRDGGQAQYVDVAVPTTTGSLASLLEWATQNPAEDLGVAALARRVHMSERTFARRFRAEVGTTPAAWVARLRLARAQELLERSSLSVDEVAGQVGFGAAAVLRRHFANELGTSPQAYRRTFCGDGTDPISERTPV